MKSAMMICWKNSHAAKVIVGWIFWSLIGWLFWALMAYTIYEMIKVTLEAQ